MYREITRVTPVVSEEKHAYDQTSFNINIKTHNEQNEFDYL